MYLDTSNTVPVNNLTTFLNECGQIIRQNCSQLKDQDLVLADLAG